MPPGIWTPSEGESMFRDTDAFFGYMLVFGAGVGLGMLLHWGWMVLEKGL